MALPDLLRERLAALPRRVRMALLAAVVVLAAGLIAAAVWSGLRAGRLAYGFVDIDKATLSFLRQGRIDEFLADEGDRVAQGAVLARLNVDDLVIQRANQQASCRSLRFTLDELENGYQSETVDKALHDYEQATHQFEIAELSFSRKDPLHKRKAISDQEYDEARLQREQARSAMNSAEAYYRQLKGGYRSEQIGAARENYAACTKALEYYDYQIEEMSVIRAPFDGFIRVKYLEVGDIAGPSGSVFEIAVQEARKVRAYLSEEQLAAVHLDDELTVTDHAGTPWKGRVIYISDSAVFTPKNVITEELRGLLVYEVRLLIDGGGTALRDGQSVSVHLP